MRNFNLLINVILLIVGLIFGCGSDKARPKGAEDISYWEPAWYDNEHIIYTKQVDTVKFHYGLLAEIANMRSELTRRDWFVCVTDLEGKEEKILKQFSVVDPEAGGDVRKIFMVDGGKEVPLDTRPQRPSSYSCVGDLITFVGRFSEGGYGTPGPIYVMNKDGSQIKKISDDGDNPRLSPDGKQVLYEAINPELSFRNVPNPRFLCLVNIDGTGNRKLLDDAGAGVWSPDGERIVYRCSSASEERDKKNIFIYNLKTGEKKEFIRSSGSPRDWTPDGKRIFIFPGGFCNVLTGEGEYFNIQTNQWEESKNHKIDISEYSKVKKDKIVRYSVGNYYPWPLPESEEAIRIGLNYERLSPDAKRLVGDPKVDIAVAKASKYDSSIGIQERGKYKELTVLRINHVKTIK